MAVRTVGSAHSFTPLSVTEETLVCLDDYRGVLEVDRENLRVRVKSGTKLFELSAALHEHGLALENLGDIDVQSVAGAVSTGTHGTGTAFGNISTQVTALRFVDGNGEIVSCSETDKPELLRAVRLSLGAFGVITEMTLRVVPAYKLALKIAKARLETVLENLEDYHASCRNFEFYWFPNTPYVMTKELTATDAPVSRVTALSYAREMLLENYAFLGICELGYRFPGWNRKLSAFAASTTGNSGKVDWSHRVFSTPRLVRFNEMEYSVPQEAYPSAMRALAKWVNDHNYDVLFPLENRFVRGDDNYLSPAYGRNSAYVAAHVYHKKPYRDYFRELEAIFRHHDGRPHWGKLHTLDFSTIHRVYPEFDRFCALRDMHDPRGMFLSPYLRTLFQDAPSFMPDYDYYRERLRNQPYPYACLDGTLLRKNVALHLRRAGTKSVRLATKSIRSVPVMEMIMGMDERFSGVMAYHGAEAIALHERGFVDILLGYPVVDPLLLKQLGTAIGAGAQICLMADLPEHLRTMDRVGRSLGITFPVCVDLDCSSRYPGLHFGVHRSSVKNLSNLEAFLEILESCSHLRLDGLMGYEAQIAGVGDTNNGSWVENKVVQYLKRRSVSAVAARRRAAIQLIEGRGHRLRFVNAGGTGSLETSREEPWITEVTVGSGFYQSHLFDHYRNFCGEPALFYAVPVVRRPTGRMVVAHGGGFVASGPPGAGKAPAIYLPPGGKLLPNEGVGEVQTPIHFPTGQVPAINDPVFFRHAKAGELCERFTEIILLESAGMTRLKTYRGEGWSFG